MHNDVFANSRAKAAKTRAQFALQPVLARLQLTLGSPVFIRIFKTEQTLEVWMQKKTDGKPGKYLMVASYPICAYSGTLGPKQREGDMQAPEGVYSVRSKQLNPASQFHLSFNLGYPNAFDQAHARTGSALMVHGNCVSIGCYAMTDSKIEEIYTMVAAALENGQPAVWVHSFPFALTPANLQAHANSDWIDFWRELAPIYQAFERTNLPPQVNVQGKHYKLAK